ncbi:MAG: class I SAM-dependent methyltransferase [Puniceicoccales bacterium]
MSLLQAGNGVLLLILIVATRLPSILFQSMQPYSDPFTAIHPNDDMYDSPAKAYYYLYGYEAAELVEKFGGLEKVTGRPPSILDYPCGFGRVMRHLRKQYPSARILGADINRAGVGFCGSTFGAIPVNAPSSPADFKLGELFDVIFCGSLLTHFAEPLWDELLDFFQRHLLERGRVIFTTTGRHSAAWLRSGSGSKGLGISDEILGPILADYDATGFGYRDYTEGTGYGAAISHPEWVLAKVLSKPGWRLVHAAEQAWGSNQDVFVLEKIPEAV